jgi:cytochrome c551/c552
MINNMHAVLHGTRFYRVVVLAGTMAGCFTISAPAAGVMPPPQQNALVQKYCAVCHTDAAKNGGLSLEHYDAAQANPALAAMLLSKLQNGAMGAAGLGIPDTATRDAWIAATAAQAERAKGWTVIRSEAPGPSASVLTASIVRDVAPRIPDTGAPLYRLTLACNIASQHGEMQLTWSPAPQTNRTFSVSVDGNPGIPHRLEGRDEKMGNGTAGASGIAAAAMLNVPLPQKTLTITDLFPGETVTFPLGDLDQVARRQLAVCLPGDRE